MKGGIILKKIIRKLLICCLAILCFVGLLAMGVKATGDETGNCTLESVTLKMDNVEQTFTGDLKPYKVPADVDWKNFIKNVELTKYSALYDEACKKTEHQIAGVLKILDGGTLSKDSVTSYHSQEEITLPTPTKEGYDFAGWTGEGITTPNKNVTIPTGTTGPRSYIANWTKKQQASTTTVKNDTVPVKKQLAVGTKITYKKAVYKITKSTRNSAEVTLLSIKNKKVKKFTIPAKVKLSDGRKAKVTGIAKKAFNKCKKLKKIVIKSKYLKKKQIAKNAFYGLSKKAKMKVPKNKRKVYQRWFRAKKIKIYS